MDELYYKEYENTVCAISHETFRLLTWLYDDGPVKCDKVRVSDNDYDVLISNGLVKEEGGMISMTKMGDEMIESFMDIIDKYC